MNTHVDIHRTPHHRTHEIPQSHGRTPVRAPGTNKRDPLHHFPTPAHTQPHTPLRSPPHFAPLRPPASHSTITQRNHTVDTSLVHTVPSQHTNTTPCPPSSPHWCSSELTRCTAVFASFAVSPWEPFARLASVALMGSSRPLRLQAVGQLVGQLVGWVGGWVGEAVCYVHLVGLGGLAGAPATVCACTGSPTSCTAHHLTSLKCGAVAGKHASAQLRPRPSSAGAYQQETNQPAKAVTPSERGPRARKPSQRSLDVGRGCWEARVDAGSGLGHPVQAHVGVGPPDVVCEVGHEGQQHLL